MSKVILVEVDVISPAGAASTLRFADRAIRPFAPGDPDRPNVAYDARLIEPPSLKRMLFDDLTTLSPGLGVGAMRLSNADRGLNPWLDHAWGELRTYRVEEGQPFASAELIFRGLAGAPAGGVASGRRANVTASLYDYRAELEGPLQTVTFAGTNGVGGVLYEGQADGLKGRVKPIALGDLRAAHLPAPQVNPGVMAHLLNDGAIAGDVAIFDRGDSAGFVDQGALVGPAFDAFSPAPASWVRDLSRGLVKINGDPAGTLSFGCRGDAPSGLGGGYVETTGPILRRLLLKAGVPAERIGASVAGLAEDAPIGAWFGEPIAAREAVGWVARSALAGLLPDRQGVWTASTLAPPAETPDHEIGEHDVVALSGEEIPPPPVGQVKVGWGRTWTQFAGLELAAALRGTAAEERLAKPYRWAEDEDAVAKARFPRTFRTLEISTALREEADALALAARIKALFGLRPDGRQRRQWRVTVELTSGRLAAELGQTVSLTYSPEGLNDRFLLIGEEPLRPRRNLVVWTLWG